MSPVRRVRRVVRKIDPWTVLKVSLVFNALLALAFVLGSVIFWSIFVNAGIPERISEVAELLTLSFNPDGPTMFRIAVLLAVIWTVLATGFATLGALLYNLISDVVGGIEVIVLEESLAPPSQVVRPAAPKKPRAVRLARFRRTAKEEPATAAATPPVTAPPAPTPKPARPAQPAQPARRPTEPAGRPAAPAARTVPPPAATTAPSPNGGQAKPKPAEAPAAVGKQSRADRPAGTP